MATDPWHLDRDSPPPADCLARWKPVRRRNRDLEFRAVCGRPGCPGSLGLFREMHFADLAAIDAFYDRWRKNLEELDQHYVAMERRADFPPAIVEKRRAFVAESRRLLAQQRVLVEQSYVHRRAVAEELNDRPDVRRRFPDWVIVAEAPHQQRDTPRERRPMPIYYGFPDSGYRISLGGKRSRQGRRIGRRGFVPRPDKIELASWPNALEDDRLARGQMPLPPCRIVCPVCAARNHVDLPPGFELVEDED